MSGYNLASSPLVLVPVQEFQPCSDIQWSAVITEKATVDTANNESAIVMDASRNLDAWGKTACVKWSPPLLARGPITRRQWVLLCSFFQQPKDPSANRKLETDAAFFCNFFFSPGSYSEYSQWTNLQCLAPSKLPGMSCWSQTYLLRAQCLVTV